MRISQITIVALLALASCKGNIEEIPVSAEAQANTEAADAIVRQQATQNEITAPIQQGIQLPTSTGQQLNPPHGQPGHRCDIAVGSPLPSSNPIQSQYVAPEMTPEVNLGTPAVAANSNAKLNPPHGEPGHRCDIAVGAPLNSAPAQATPAQTITQPVSIQQPAQVTAEGFSGKPNPEHGQAGHRCDIAVGAILP